MKLSRVITLSLILFAPHAVAAQNRVAAEGAWKPFFAKFRAAVKRRDREALKKMMVLDFHTSGGVGDDNQDGDSRDETFEFWDKPDAHGWKALAGVLAKGTAPMAARWDAGEKRKYISRIAPPTGNVRRHIQWERIDWYAVFEFRGGQWYCAVFVQCCA